MVRLALIALAVFAVCATPVSAGKPSPLILANTSGGGQIDTILSKYNDHPIPASGYIFNSRKPCTWDINDHTAFSAAGYLDPGAQASGAICHVADYNPIFRCLDGVCANWSSKSNAHGAKVASSSSDLDVRVCWAPQNRCFQGGGVWNASTHIWEYSLCTQAVYTPGDPALQLIPNAGGEVYSPPRQYGVISTITLTVSNPSSRQVKNISARWGISSDFFLAPGCTSTTQTNSDYPFRWTTS